MSRIPDDVQFCDRYKALSEPETLPCGGCTRAHNQWSRFEEDVDNVVPLVVKTVTESSSNNIWLEGYSKTVASSTAFRWMSTENYQLDYYRG